MPSLDPAVVGALQLRSNEAVVNHWNGLAGAAGGVAGGGLVVLTNLRLIVFEVRGVFKKSYLPIVDRNLETVAEPTVKGGGPEYALIAAGKSIWIRGPIAHAARDEIAQLRSMRMVQLGQAPPGVATREVISREVVRIPCRYCGHLLDQTDPRCPACFAPVGR